MKLIVWLRQDLRLADNPALFYAAEKGEILPVYIFEKVKGAPDPRQGEAGLWWLRRSLNDLSERLGGLRCLEGDASEILHQLVSETGAGAVYWNRRYDPDGVETDSRIKAQLEANGTEVRSFPGNLLLEPWGIRTKAGGPFKVYTPFWKALSTSVSPLLLPEPAGIRLIDYRGDTADCRLSGEPLWTAGWPDLWQPGEAAARACLSGFLKKGMNGYEVGRDRPDLNHISRLSPALHFGESSPGRIWQVVRTRMDEGRAGDADGWKFLSQLAWREFCHHLLFHFPDMATRNWKPDFDRYPWQEDKAALSAWQYGRTGYPLVDAGMRELRRTGYMHNRVRMVAASFLVKHLGIHWPKGEEWFRQNLLDADLANNAVGWQWVAGSGPDAAPYFRIFNPTGQARKFDPDGVYIRKWCPELSRLDTKDLHAPFEAAPMDLARAGITLGREYPHPVVDHEKARQRALAGYEAVKRARIDPG